MNSRKVVELFFKTLLIGGVVGLVTSIFVKSSLYAGSFNPLDIKNLLVLIAWYFVYGLLYSVVSQAGFFSYLFINRFGLSIFRSFWPTVQLLVIAFVLFDLVYFPYQATKGDVSIIWYILMTAAILAVGIIVSTIKAKQTNRSAFVPALFLMVVMTAIEWVPGMRTEGTDYATIMIITLLACNAYQLLALTRLSKVDGKAKKNNETNKVNKPDHKVSVSK
ncbi:MAG TPA: KinB-signaling pathway activation protein [Virgibacillus sp.]|nr:KinB-signaling pathway activation protein [Virgibacillus sp.]